MAVSSMPPEPTAVPAAGSISGTNTPKQGYRFALIVLTSLFFVWGFITCLNDILITHLRDVFALNYTRAMLVQFCFFGAWCLRRLELSQREGQVGKGGWRSDRQYN